MSLPFTVEQFVEVFAQYNLAVWPAPLVLTALAALCVLAMFTRLRWRGLLISAVLGVLWLWLALAYHWAFFSRINPIAIAFALVSAAGALLFLWHGCTTAGSVSAGKPARWTGSAPRSSATRSWSTRS